MTLIMFRSGKGLHLAAISKLLLASVLAALLWGHCLLIPSLVAHDRRSTPHIVAPPDWDPCWTPHTFAPYLAGPGIQPRAAAGYVRQSSGCEQWCGVQRAPGRIRRDVRREGDGSSGGLHQRGQYDAVSGASSSLIRRSMMVLEADRCGPSRGRPLRILAPAWTEDCRPTWTAQWPVGLAIILEGLSGTICGDFHYPTC